MEQEIQRLRDELAALALLVKQQQARIIALEVLVLSQQGGK